MLVANAPNPVTSGLLRSTGVANWGHYQSLAIDEGLAAAGSTVDPAESQSAYQTDQQLIIHALPIYTFGRRTRYLLVRDDTGGVCPAMEASSRNVS